MNVKRALPRVVVALGSLVVAWVVAGSVPGHRPWYGGDCGSVSDWTSNQDIGCNAPLLDRAGVVVALLAIATVLVVDASLKARRSIHVRAINTVAWTLAPILALLAVNQITDGSTWPHAGPALATLAVAVALFVAVPLSGADHGRARAVVLALAAAASAGLFAYAQMLWGGNGT